MKRELRKPHSVVLPTFIAASAAAFVLAACGGGAIDDVAPDTVALATAQSSGRTLAITPGSDVIAYWNQIATNTVNVAPPPPALRRSDVRTSRSISRRCTSQCSMRSTRSTARTRASRRSRSRHGGCLPRGGGGRRSVSRAQRPVPESHRAVPGRIRSYIATLPDGDAKTRGLQIGQEVAVQIVALRADDGRLTLVTYTPTSLPGRFRGINPVGTSNPFVKPFTLTSASQFRADGPPPLTSVEYAADVNETKALGAANSNVRTAEQTEIARFHTEPPPVFWTRNLRIFATADRASPRTHAHGCAVDRASGRVDRLLRIEIPLRQLAAFQRDQLADTDGNAATEADPSWTPVVPTPNHPEYPAAHSCVTGAMAEVLQQVFGTKKLAFDWSSSVTGTTHHFDSTDDIGKEVQLARIAGGMHFRTATVHGEVLGMKVGKWILKNHFQERK